MHIIHSVSSIESKASGPAYSVPSLARALAGQGHEASVYSLGAPALRQSGSYLDQRFAAYSDKWPIRKLGVSSTLREGFRASRADAFHVHGLWMMPNVYPARAAQEQGRPLILSPRGMLGPDALQFSYYIKMIFWFFAQRSAARRVDCFHATSQQEANDIRAFGLRQPVAIIPNGVDLPDLMALSECAEAPYVVSLGRIHPKKALDRLILAWRDIEPAFPDWRLKIVGPDEVGYSRFLLRLIRELGLKNASICGPVYGEAKLELLRQAEVFALPTLNENFAMTVAESLSCGTPVISTKGAPWAGLVANKCGWWIDHGPESMAAALREAMSLSPDARSTMGANGRAWMERDFGWQGVAETMADVYRWVAIGGERPACVLI